VYIIGDRNFKGDMVAFEVKESRAEEERLMGKKFRDKDRDYETFKIIRELELEEDDWKSLKLRRWQETLAQRNQSKDAGNSVKAHTLPERQRIQALYMRGQTAENPVDIESDGDRGHPVELD